MHDLTTTLRTHKGEWLEVRPAEVCALLDAQDAEIAALTAERDRMAAALRFYANEEVYKPHPSCLAFGAGITIDRGSVARAALSPEQES